MPPASAPSTRVLTPEEEAALLAEQQAAAPPPEQLPSGQIAAGYGSYEVAPPPPAQGTTGTEAGAVAGAYDATPPNSSYATQPVSYDESGTPIYAEGQGPPPAPQNTYTPQAPNPVLSTDTAPLPTTYQPTPPPGPSAPDQQVGASDTYGAYGAVQPLPATSANGTLVNSNAGPLSAPGAAAAERDRGAPDMGFTGGGESTYYGGVGGLTYQPGSDQIQISHPNQSQAGTPGTGASLPAPGPSYGDEDVLAAERAVLGQGGTLGFTNARQDAPVDSAATLYPVLPPSDGVISFPTFQESAVAPESTHGVGAGDINLDQFYGVLNAQNGDVQPTSTANSTRMKKGRTDGPQYTADDFYDEEWRNPVPVDEASVAADTIQQIIGGALTHQNPEVAQGAEYINQQRFNNMPLTGRPTDADMAITNAARGIFDPIGSAIAYATTDQGRAEMRDRAARFKDALEPAVDAIPTLGPTMQEGADAGISFRPAPTTPENLPMPAPPGTPFMLRRQPLPEPTYDPLSSAYLPREPGQSGVGETGLPGFGGVADWLRQNVTDPLMANSQDTTVFGVDVGGGLDKSGTKVSAQEGAVPVPPGGVPNSDALSQVFADEGGAMLPADAQVVTRNGYDFITDANGDMVGVNHPVTGAYVPFNFPEGASDEEKQAIVNDIFAGFDTASATNPAPGPSTGEAVTPSEPATGTAAGDGTSDTVYTGDTTYTGGRRSSSGNYGYGGGGGGYSGGRRSSGGGGGGGFSDDGDDFGLKLDDFIKDFDGDGRISLRDRQMGQRAFDQAKASRRKKGKRGSTSNVPSFPASPIREHILNELNTNFAEAKAKQQSKRGG